MQKVTQLHTYLASAGLFSADQLSSWVEEVNVKVGGKDEGDRILLFRQTYRAVFLVESYQYSLNDIEKLNAHVAIWLAENDDRTDLDDASLTLAIDVLDDDLADVELTLMFDEDVYISPNDDGDIPYQEKIWSLEEAEYTVAESATVETALYGETEA